MFDRGTAHAGIGTDEDAGEDEGSQGEAPQWKHHWGATGQNSLLSSPGEMGKLRDPGGNSEVNSHDNGGLIPLIKEIPDAQRTLTEQVMSQRATLRLSAPVLHSF